MSKSKIENLDVLLMRTFIWKREDPSIRDFNPSRRVSKAKVDGAPHAVCLWEHEDPIPAGQAPIRVFVFPQASPLVELRPPSVLRFVGTSRSLELRGLRVPI
jgi:hypothetical protein